MNVRVHRDYELGRRDRPESEVHAVRGTDHPARVKEQTFASAAGARVANQVSDATIRGTAAQSVAKESQRLAELPATLLMKPHKRVSKGSVLAQELAGAGQDLSQMFASVDPVNETAKPPSKLGAAGAPHRLARLGAQAIEGPLDAATRGKRIAESQAGCDQARHFLIERLRVAVDEPDRILGARSLAVATVEERVEPFAGSIHLAQVLAILQAPPQ